MIRPIAIGLAPNLTKKDAYLALAKIVNPYLYKKGNATYNLEKWFEKYFSVTSATAFTSGRGALYTILRALDISKGDEVIVQAFTCAAVIQAVLTTGATPVYADITDSYNLDPGSVRKRITNKTKAIIVQHTFGIAADLNELQKIASEKKIFIIEDAAHTVGGTYKGGKLGTVGIAGIFSFGRDKAFSSTSGGIAVTRDKELGKKISTFARKKEYPSMFWIFQHLLHPVAFYFFILPFYNFLLGKVILVILQKLHLLSRPVDTKRTILSEDEVKRLPPVLSALALSQLQHITEVNKKRTHIANQYEQKLPGEMVYHFDQPLLRYPIRVDNPKQLTTFLRKKKIIVGNWYSNTIDPKGVSLQKLEYRKGSCPKAEEIASHVINLPTYASLSDKEINRLCTLLTQYVNKSKHTK